MSEEQKNKDALLAQKIADLNSHQTLSKVVVMMANDFAIAGAFYCHDAQDIIESYLEEVKK